jgi:hypothetical protein
MTESSSMHEPSSTQQLAVANAYASRYRLGPPPANARLCYVDDPWAFFTTADVGEVYGDDWDDAPYEHNAGEPYVDRWPTWVVAVETVLATPRMGHLNSPYSVDEINAGAAPWFGPDITGSPQVRIYAGCTYAAFLELIGASGGRVYESRQDVKVGMDSAPPIRDLEAAESLGHHMTDDEPGAECRDCGLLRTTIEAAQRVCGVAPTSVGSDDA